MKGVGTDQTEKLKLLQIPMFNRLNLALLRQRFVLIRQISKSIGMR
jgi:hypothetical protein